MELKDYWSTIRRRWLLVVLTFLIVVGGAAAITALATPQYASSAKLFVSTQQSDANTAIQGGTFASQRIASYANLVGDESLASTVSTNLEGAYAPAALSRAVTATVVPDTVNLTITATTDDAVASRDIAQAYAVALSDKIESLETLDGKSRAFVKASITDDAQVDTTQVSPSPVRNLALGAVLGLLLGVGLAVARDLLDTSISTGEDVQAVTDTPILGHVISDVAAVRADPQVALKQPTPWSEAFRVLRTNMQFVEVDHEQRMFVISSALPGEGKSTTSANLAITLALAGARVALVDCDLRRPMLATRLGVDGAVGTTSVLIGQVKLDDALQHLDESGVQVLASGPIPPNPSELLQSHAMAELVVDLRQRFDVVLIDAPPLLPVTDSALLAAQCDGLLLVTRHGRTTKDQLAHAVERVSAVGGKTVGVVINGAPAKKAGRAYGGYGYGYGYAPSGDGEPTRRAQKKATRQAKAMARKHKA